MNTSRSRTRKPSPPATPATTRKTISRLSSSFLASARSVVASRSRVARCLFLVLSIDSWGQKKSFEGGRRGPGEGVWKLGARETEGIDLPRLPGKPPDNTELREDGRVGVLGHGESANDLEEKEEDLVKKSRGPVTTLRRFGLLIATRFACYLT